MLYTFAHMGGHMSNRESAYQDYSNNITPTKLRTVTGITNEDVYLWACLVYKTTASNWQIHLYDPAHPIKRITVHTDNKKPDRWLITKPIDLLKHGNNHVSRYNDGRHGHFVFDTDERDAVFYLKELAFFKTEEDAKKWSTDSLGIPHPLCEHTSLSLESEEALSKNGILYKNRQRHPFTGLWSFNGAEEALEVVYAEPEYYINTQKLGHFCVCPRFLPAKSNMLYLNDRHEHTTHEICVITSGRAEITCRSTASIDPCRLYQLNPGELALIPNGAYHLYRSVGKEPLKMVSLHFTAPELGISNLTIFNMGNREKELFNLIISDMDSNFGELADNKSVEMTSTAKKLCEVLCEYVIRNLSTRLMSDQSSRCSLEKNYSMIFSTVVKYMNNNLSRKLTIKEIETACAACKTTLTKVFAQYAQMGCMKYFTSLKLERAHEMLSSGMSCSDVAENLGFSSQAYFTKCFKQHYGIVPSEVERKI